MSEIISRIQEQERKVSSFHTLGNLLIKEGDWESEYDMLIAGTKAPFRIKVEITHSWGRPMLHILIDKQGLKILSFPDKTLYLGPFTQEAFSKFFPKGLDALLIWATLRGYPNLLDHHKSASLKFHQVSLFNQDDVQVEIIDLHHKTLLPSQVSFPERHISLAFSDFQDKNGIYYARKVEVENVHDDERLILKNREMFFNGAIPEQIFTLEKPPSFGTSYLHRSLKRKGP